MGKIKGYVAEGFEPVRDQLEKMIQSGCEDHLQLCVYLEKSVLLICMALFFKIHFIILIACK